MVQTRGSEAIDKAERRIALLTSIDQNLDLGHGLTVEMYRERIEAARTKLEAHNRLKSEFDQSCKAMKEIEKELSKLSERMLGGVATKYGKDSVQYQKAGGATRKRNSSAKDSKSETDAMPSVQTNGTAQWMQAAQNGATMAKN